MIHKNSGIEKKWIRTREGVREGGRDYHVFLSEQFISQCPKISRGLLPCSTEILVSKKGRDIRWRQYDDFPSNFYLSVPIHLVEEGFCVSETFGYRTKLCLRGENHDFLQTFCCPTIPKNFVGEPISVSLN